VTLIVIFAFESGFGKREDFLLSVVNRRSL